MANSKGLAKEAMKKVEQHLFLFWEIRIDFVPRWTESDIAKLQPLAVLQKHIT